MGMVHKRSIRQFNNNKRDQYFVNIQFTVVHTKIKYCHIVITHLGFTVICILVKWYQRFKYIVHEIIIH